jgi:hypothetical protein
MFYGLRGVGKTVLLNQAEGVAEGLGYVVDHIEMSEGDDFRQVAAKTCRKVLLRVSTLENLRDKARSALRVLKAFTIRIPDGPDLQIDIEAALGTGDSGDLQSDLVDLFVALGDAAAEANKPICFLIDEVQYLEEGAYAGLIAASHRISQKGFPIVFICAGLPQIAALSGEAKSYAERLFDFIPVSKLEGNDAVVALTGPAREKGVAFEPGAVEAVIQATEGYPYFIQEYGRHIWDAAQESPITAADYEIGHQRALDTLDQSFFKVRIDRATQGEKSFMRAMAKLGNPPYKMGDVARQLRKKLNSLGPVRATLISKGFVYSPQHGIIDFTVPQFDDFIRRHFHE